jgi:hypothetical protein
MRRYDGIAYRIWVNEQHGLESAVQRPISIGEDSYRRYLEAIYLLLLQFRGLPERVHRSDRLPANEDLFTVMDLGADKQGAWGPGLLALEDFITLEELTEAAVYDIRHRMPD